MKVITLGVLTTAIALTSVPALAHHSFAAEYDGNKPVTLKGTLTKIEWINPHSWIYVDVKGDDGKMVSWSIEFGAPNILLRKGLRKSDFPAGAEVVVKGFRAKSGSATINATTMTFADGRNFYTGSSNPEGPGAER